ncbi:MAG: hypothetical protein CBB68_06725 [Rhodospirillaceae bacterium TMED8]|nr:gamma-glutamyl-gamma-aminobutyrate hydrolase [Magnetovibrio sp.]MAH85465.1 gamma-glutamyl-gamma-aminobutyrate hydrolase [Magnetovibrio sp.]OUT47969.1 MAG: hypothetical protein CBB68_14670 [Rhodospirillaceae bacterium TMED8]OUT51309.1 MAG: hypothetical protein CBB68_06725 [Rhodospirillaceae bacterium TMED8]
MVYRVALSMRTFQNREPREIGSALATDWIHWLEANGMVPVLVPNGLSDPERYLDALSPDLVILTGGGERGTSPERDIIEEVTIKRAYRCGLPLLGVCRGLQVLCQLAGGELHAVSGHTAVYHDVSIKPAWHKIYGKQIRVNSFHNFGFRSNSIGENFQIAATDCDGNIEAAYHKKLPVAGVMWHPERTGAPIGDSCLVRALIEGEASWE